MVVRFHSVSYCMLLSVWNGVGVHFNLCVEVCEFIIKSDFDDAED